MVAREKERTVISTGGQRTWTCLRYRGELSLSEGEKRGGNVRIIDLPIDRTNGGPRHWTPQISARRGSRALCLRIVLAGVRAARCRRVTRFPVFLSGGAWCRLGFSSDKKLLSLSLSLSPPRSRRLFASLSLSPSRFAPLRLRAAHLSFSCSRPSYN